MALYSRVHVWVTNEVLTASDLNNEFNNILTNANAAQLTGYSATVSQMQQVTDPGGVGTESLAASTSDEIQRLRFKIKEAIGGAQWYSPAPASLTSLFASVSQVSVPGAITMYGGAAAPTGYLLCDGSSLLRASYPALFTAIGTAYGAADGLSFNVPDLRGKFPRGTDNGAGTDPDAAGRTNFPGGNTGDSVGSLQGQDLYSHTHEQSAHNHRIMGNVGGSASVLGPTGTAVVAGFAGFSGTYAATGQNPTQTKIIEDTVAVNADFGGSETRPINVYVNFIIKT